MTRRHEKPLKRVNPSGKTVYVARATDDDGHRHYLGTRELKREAQDLIDAFYEAGSAPAGRKTIGDYADKIWLQRHPRTERTQVSYEGRLKAVLDVKIERRKVRDWPLSEFRRRHAAQLLDVLLRKQQRAAKGAKGVLLALSAMYTDAVEDEETEINPFVGLRVRASDPRIVKPSRVIRVWSWEQMHKFAAACGQWEPMVRVLSDCGLRIGELVPLERPDLYLGDGLCGDDRCRMEGPHLHVRRTAWRGRVTAGTKTDHGEAYAGRMTPVAPVLAGMLAEWPRRIDTRLLFPTSTGTLWDRNFYRDVWEPAKKASGVAATPHEFRHSHVSLMRAAGVDPADLAAWVGHSVMTASAHYTHSTGLSVDAARMAVGE